jgi:hypothetical protein
MKHVNRHRIIAVGLLLACLALIGAGIGWPAERYVTTRYREQERLIERVAKARARAQELPVVTAAVDAVTTNALWERAYREASTAAAATQLEVDSRSILGTAGTAPVVEKLKPTAAGEVVEIAERVRLALTADRLADILERLERAPRLLRVSALKVESPLVQRDDRNELLDVTLDLTGYWVDPAKASSR